MPWGVQEINGNKVRDILVDRDRDRDRERREIVSAEGRERLLLTADSSGQMD